MNSNTITKKCNTCQLEKAGDSFHKNKNSCRDCLNKKKKEYSRTERAIKLGMIRHARERAKKYNIAFNITVEDIKTLPEYCPVFPWIKLEISRDKISNNSYTLDRIDNSKGYIQNNIMVISNRANSLKRDMSLTEMKALLEYMNINKNSEDEES